MQMFEMIPDISWPVANVRQNTTESFQKRLYKGGGVPIVNIDKVTECIKLIKALHKSQDLFWTGFITI